VTSRTLASILPALVTLLQEIPSTAAAATADPASQAAIVERKLHFLAWAYTVVWVILALYLVSLSVRLRRLSGALRRLRARLGL